MFEGGTVSSQDETRRKTVAVTSATSAQQSDEPCPRPACVEAAPLNKWQTAEAFIERGGGVGLAS